MDNELCESEQWEYCAIPFWELTCNNYDECVQLMNNVIEFEPLGILLGLKKIKVTELPSKVGK